MRTPRLPRPAFALSLLGSLAAAQTTTEQFPLPSADLGFFGLSYTADFLAAPSGTITSASVELHYTTGTLDAADLILTLQAPSKGVPSWQLTGGDLGWSGSGTFQATVSTDVLDGAIDLGDPPPDFSLYSLDIRAVGFQPLSGTFQSSSYRVDVDRWIDLGHGLAGTGGVEPTLDPDALLLPASPFTLDLAGAPGGAPALLALGISAQDLPLLGGVLVPAPVAVVPLAVGPLGDATLAFPWPGGVPKGIPLYCQAWIADPGAPQGFSATSAFKAVTP